MAAKTTVARIRYTLAESAKSSGEPDPNATRIGRPVFIYADLARAWLCDACGKELNRGTPVRITITVGAPRNKVEHHPPCRPRSPER